CLWHLSNILYHQLFLHISYNESDDTYYVTCYLKQEIEDFPECVLSPELTLDTDTDPFMNQYVWTELTSVSGKDYYTIEIPPGEEREDDWYYWGSIRLKIRRIESTTESGKKSTNRLVWVVSSPGSEYAYDPFTGKILSEEHWRAD
ncbi:MAG: hypothetical protein R6V77_03880, partial [Candidatus Cloacimonadaceae bacterium]